MKRPPRQRPEPGDHRRRRSNKDPISIDIERDDPGPALQAAAAIIGNGIASLWWLSATEIYLDPSAPMELEEGDTVDSVTAWSLGLLVTSWQNIAELTEGEPPCWPA